jgi:hypothetical protein
VAWNGQIGSSSLVVAAQYLLLTRPIAPLSTSLRSRVLHDHAFAIPLPIYPFQAIYVFSWVSFRTQTRNQN